jgi:hypothetical protein
MSVSPESSGNKKQFSESSQKSGSLIFQIFINNMNIQFTYELKVEVIVLLN